MTLKVFECLVEGCDAGFEGESEDAILQKVAIHAREAHGMQEMPPDVVDEVRAGIHDRDPNPPHGLTGD